jgi:hypothetical protein
MGLKIKLPMKEELENKGAKDIINNWSVGGRTRHIGVRFNFLREMKENGTGLLHMKTAPYFNKEPTCEFIQQTFQTFSC